MTRPVAVTRLIIAYDAPFLAGLHHANRELLAPWSPERGPTDFRLEGQRKVVADALAQDAPTGPLSPT